MSFVLCEWISSILVDPLRHLLSIISDCPLAIRHKKGKYICRGDFVVGERFFVFVELWIVSRCFIMYLFFWLMMYSLFLIGFSMIGGDTLIVYVLVSHCLLIYIYELFVIYVFILGYVKSRSYFCFTCIFHTCVYAFVEVF